MWTFYFYMFKYERFIHSVGHAINALATPPDGWGEILASEPQIIEPPTLGIIFMIF